MKKNFLFFIMVCMTILCSACTREDFHDMIRGTYKDHSPDNIEIDVIVGGVDGGILNGARVCEWGEQYAYYDDGVLYYYEDKASEVKTIQCSSPTQMAMTEDYIYYCHGKSLTAIDLKTMEQHSVIYNDDDEYISGINVYPDEVLVVTNKSHIYVVSGLEANNVDEYGFHIYPHEFLSAKNHCANEYGNLGCYIFLDGKKFTFNPSSFWVKEGSNAEKEKNYPDDKINLYIYPEYIAEYEGKLYLLLQRYENTRKMYKDKEYDYLICVDPKTETSESIYKTPGHQEQIVNFSIENNEMYLLMEGILYKSDLKGEQREELANYVGSDTLTFEYGNDTLFVYDGYKLLGQYK